MKDKVNRSSNPESSISIFTEKLCKRFNREWIFRDLQYHFLPCTTYAITGPNGSGKSTLLQILWGQMPPTSGAVRYNRVDADVDPEKIQKHLAIAAPYMDLIEEFTLLEQLRFHFSLKPLRSGLTVDDVISIMYLDDARNKYISNFSSGMKQRLKLGLAFYTESEILFLDEPGSNLDAHAFSWYLTQLEKVHGKKLVFIASNNPEEYPQEAVQINMKAIREPF